MEEEIFPKNKESKTKLIRGISFVLVFIAVVLFFYVTILSSPQNSEDTIIHVSRGQSLKDITIQLENKNVVRQASTLQSFVVVFKGDRQISVGDYLFTKDLSVWQVGLRLAFGRHNINPIKITLPEGITSVQMADIIKKQMPNFNEEIFLDKTKDKEGYLFPETYFFFPLTTEDEIIYELSTSFKTKISSLDKEIKNSGHSLNEIITMASIIEEEAKGKNDAPIISGILWKRLEKGIPLQVDADKWTYKNKGLPTSPISNPGIASIKAVLSPVSSPYLYYLHDKNGVAHYATTFSQHQSNIAKYLK